MDRSSSCVRTLAIVAALLFAPVPAAWSTDCNGNGVPDEFDVLPNQFRFAARVPYTAGTGAQSIAAADLDGDGDLDLAVADAGDGDVSILLNDGSGSFVQGGRFPVAANPLEVIATDLDGDGGADLAIWNQTGIPNPSGAFVLINQGNATFAPPVFYNPGVPPKDMAAGDLDGDGDTDLVFVGFASSMAALFNKGDGTFPPYVYLPGSGAAGVSGVTVADVDGDLDSDLVTADSFGYDVSVLVNLGSGVFAYPVTYATTGAPGRVAAADFDGDGDSDLATCNTNPGGVTILENDGTGAFVATETLGGLLPGALAVADLDLDGNADLAVTAGQVVVFLGNVDSTFAARRDYPAGLGPHSPAPGDLSGDGLPDLAVVNSTEDGISVLHNVLVAFSRDCNANLVPDECEPDADSDGVPDTCDLCPGADDLLDTDADGTPDCGDACPFDPHKTAPGNCGCGLPDMADCTAAQSAWPALRHDNRRTSRSSIVASQTGTPLYPSRGAGGVSDAGGTPTQAAQSPYGTLYYYNGVSLVAIDPTDGTWEWTSGSIGSAPVLGPEGTIYGTRRVGGGTTDPGFIVALHPNGALKWSVKTAEPSLGFSGLGSSPEGTVYGGYIAVTQQAPLLTAPMRFAISAEGQLLWKLPGSVGGSWQEPVIDTDGALYIAGDDVSGSAKVMKIDPTAGAVIWSVNPPAGALSRMLIADNGLLVVATGGTPPNGVHALDPTSGVEVWMQPFDEQTWGDAPDPFMLHGGEIGAIWEGAIYRFDPDHGQPVRKVPFPGTARSVTGVAVGGDNTVYLWNEHQVKAVSPFTGELLFAYIAKPTGECLAANQPTILRDGSIFIGWHRRTYCEDYTGSNHYTTLAPATPTDVEGASSLRLAVLAAPNPTTAEVSFTLTIPAPGPASFQVYDARGRLVATLLDRTLPAGRVSLGWRGERRAGARMPAGVYFYRFTLGPTKERGKFVLLR